MQTLVNRPLMAILLMALCLAGAPAMAQMLPEALALAYSTNPELEAARAQLRSVDESVPLARSGYLPSISASGTVNRTHSETERAGGSFGVDGFDTDGSNTSKTVQLQVNQPLYRGGRTMAGLREARNLVEAQRAALATVEQRVLNQAIVAYLDVVRDRAVLELNQNNVRVLERQLEASQDRFRVGEITRTDVSQSESRLAGARAEEVLARGNLRSSEATFERVIGAMPETLEAPQTATLALPPSLEDAKMAAVENNPAVIAALFAERAARDGIDVDFGTLLPELNLVGSLSRSWDPSATIDRSDSVSVQARLSVPLYQSGAASARVRQSKQIARQRLSEIDQTRREITETAIAAWAQLQATQAAIEARNAQVDAAEIALEGVRQEAQVGSRTTLDILDAEQEALNARVALVRAERDALVASYGLLSVVGRLTAEALGLDVERYDPDAYADRVDTKFWGTSID